MRRENVTEEEFTTEESANQMMDYEKDILASILDAAEDASNEVHTVKVSRAGKTYFTFRVSPMSETELYELRKKYTRFTVNKRTGIKVSQGLDTAKFRSSVIYNSTIPEDREKLWDNKDVWEGLRKKGKHIINALDVIDSVLLPGEKDDIMNHIDEINGFGANEELVETVKN